MKVSCLPTETGFDVQCPVCGRGFLLLWEPTLSLQRSSLRRAARHALCAHHETRGTHRNAHSEEVFDLAILDDSAKAGSYPWILFGRSRVA